MQEIDENAIRTGLVNVPIRCAAVFAACCVTRLKCIFSDSSSPAFSAPQGPLFMRALARLWAAIEGSEVIDSIAGLLHEIELAIPDNDAPDWSVETPYIEDALASLAYGIRCFLGGNRDDAIWASRRVFDAIDYYVDERCDRSECVVEEVIDPLLKSEIDRQTRDLRDLTVDALVSNVAGTLHLRSESESAIPF